MTTIRNFTNLFKETIKSKLYNITSGAPVPLNVEIDFMEAEFRENNQKYDFTWVRLASGGSKDLFFEPIPQLKVKAMAACNKTAKLTTSDGKIIQHKEQSDIGFMLFIKSQVLEEPLNLDQLLTYSLFPIFATADGFFGKRKLSKNASSST